MSKFKYIEKNITVKKNIDIYYNLLGFSKTGNSLEATKKETLFFLHGLGGDLAAWDEIRELFLKKGYRSIAVDLRGHGLSSRPKTDNEYEFNVIASDILKIIEHEDLNKVIIIGHCLGGMIAQKVAVKNNLRINKLVLIGTSCKTFEKIAKLKTNSKILKFTKLFENYLFKIYKDNRINHRKYIGTGDFNFFRVINDLKNTSINSYTKVFSKVFSFDMSSEANKIKIDSLIIVGSQDKIFSKISSSNIAKTIPNSKIILIEKADHMVIFNYPIQIVSSIDEFIYSPISVK